MRKMLLVLVVLLTVHCSLPTASAQVDQVRSGAALPTSCVPARNNIFYKVGDGWYRCTATDVWTPIPSTAVISGFTPEAHDADLTTIAGLSPSNDDLLQRKSGAWSNRTPAQLKTDLALVKADVGLGNVDNTSDANKPVSTAQQTALNLKANLVSPSFTTPTLGDASATTVLVGPATGYYPLSGAVLNGRTLNSTTVAIGAQGLAESTGTNNIWGLSGAAVSLGSGTRPWMQAIEGELEMNGSGTVTEAISLFATMRIAQGSITRWSGLYVKSPWFNPVGGNIGTANGIYVEDMLGASNNYSIYTNAGNVRLGGNTSVVGTLTTPSIFGGSATTQSITYKTTTGAGTTGADHIFQVGNNGGTEALRILNSGVVGVGTGATTSSRLGQNLVVASTSFGGLALSSWSTTGSAAPLLDFNRSRSSAVGTQGLVNASDLLFYLTARGSDGTAFQDAAAIQAYVDGTPGTGDMPGAIQIMTSLDGTASLVPRLLINNKGLIFVNGTITAAGTTGAQTINKPSGAVNFAAAATSLVVTNSLVTTSSVITCTVGTNDTTMKSVQCVAGTGSFTIFANAAATAETRVNFQVRGVN